MNKIIAIVFILFLVISCGSEHEENYAGTYVYGHEVHSFKPCNENTDFWVSFDFAGIEMHEFYLKSKEKPYQPMYIEFRGQVLNEVVGGFAENYAGLIRISEVAKYTFEVPAVCK